MERRTSDSSDSTPAHHLAVADLVSRHVSTCRSEGRRGSDDRTSRGTDCRSAAGLILAPLVAATPAWVPALLGSQWTDAVAVIPPASLHLMIVGPLSVALIGYLWAVGDASAVLRATLVGFPLMAIVMIPLLMTIGVSAVGFGWLAFGVGEGTVLIRSARKHAEFRIKPGLVPPAIFAVVGAAAGWMVSSAVGTTVLGGAVGGLVAAAVYLLALWIWHRSTTARRSSTRSPRRAANLRHVASG